MKDCTVDFLDLSLAFKDMNIFAECEDGSAECTRYTYEEKLEEFKELVKDKDWTLRHKQTVISGRDYDGLLASLVENHNGDRKNVSFEVRG